MNERELHEAQSFFLKEIYVFNKAKKTLVQQFYNTGEYCIIFL